MKTVIHGAGNENGKEKAECAVVFTLDICYIYNKTTCGLFGQPPTTFDMDASFEKKLQIKMLETARGCF